MSSGDIKIFHYDWERIDLDTRIENWLQKAVSTLDSRSDYGLYQLYGDHPVYGQDVLLYIGKAQDQTFKGRLNQHTEWYENNITRYTRLHIGRVCELEDGKDEYWGEAIDISEQVMIVAHNPSLNKKQNNTTLDAEIMKCIIMNWGDYGALLPELSSLRYSYHYWNRDFKTLTQ